MCTFPQSCKHSSCSGIFRKSWQSSMISITNLSIRSSRAINQATKHEISITGEGLWLNMLFKPYIQLPFYVHCGRTCPYAWIQGFYYYYIYYMCIIWKRRRIYEMCIDKLNYYLFTIIIRHSSKLAILLSNVGWFALHISLAMLLVSEDWSKCITVFLLCYGYHLLVLSQS